MFELSERKPGAPLELVAVAFGRTPFGVPLAQLGLPRTSSRFEVREEDEFFWGSSAMVHPRVHSKRMHGLQGEVQARGAGMGSSVYSGGEGLDSDNPVTEAEPWNHLLYNHEDESQKQILSKTDGEKQQTNRR